MSSIFGNNLKISLFGESHGPLVGATINGLASGIKINHEFINKQLNKRKAKNELTTPRQEEDDYKIVSGEFNGFTTGAPLTIIIENKNVDSASYHQLAGFRPSHSDYAAHIKYEGYQDYRGGGHFSGRLTAPIVAVCAIIIDVLAKQNIIIGSHLKSFANFNDDEVNLNKLPEFLNDFNNSDLPLVNVALKEKIIASIKEAKEAGDSLGGIIESYVINPPAGIGEPFFNSVESILSHLLFSIGGVKGVEFGSGFEIAKLFGSQANDSLIFNGKVETTTNHNGGINGGITNGMPLVIRCAFKPTPSIGKQQTTLDLNFKPTSLQIAGRHDPAIILRARVVVDSLIAFGLLDLIYTHRGRK